MSNTTVREAMTASPTSISSDATVVEAARLLTSEDVGSLPVVEGDKLVGVVTDRDLVLRVLAKDLDPNKVPVADACTHDPAVARPAEPLDAALQRMAEKQVRRLPVVDDGRLVGILAQADVARASQAAATGQMVEAISEEEPGR
jgi:CBS domain-containing protein